MDYSTYHNYHRSSIITTQQRYLLRGSVVYCKVGKDRTRWKALLPTCLITKIFRFVHHILGHLGVVKCLQEIRYMLQVRVLGKKFRRLIASCDVCQRVKHPKRSLTIEEKRHFPRPEDVRPIDTYGSLPVSKGNVPYIFVCYMFSKCIKLFALKSATTKACLNKLHRKSFLKIPNWESAKSFQTVKVWFQSVNN
jgi:hypothetical protein